MTERNFSACCGEIRYIFKISLEVERSGEFRYMSMFYPWPSMTNASSNYTPDTSSFTMWSPSEDASVSCLNSWPQILHRLCNITGNISTKPNQSKHGILLFLSVPAQPQLVAHYTKVSPFLMPSDMSSPGTVSSTG